MEDKRNDCHRNTNNNNNNNTKNNHCNNKNKCINHIEKFNLTFVLLMRHLFLFSLLLLLLLLLIVLVSLVLLLNKQTCCYKIMNKKKKKKKRKRQRNIEKTYAIFLFVLTKVLNVYNFISTITITITITLTSILIHATNQRYSLLAITITTITRITSINKNYSILFCIHTLLNINDYHDNDSDDYDCDNNDNDIFDKQINSNNNNIYNTAIVNEIVINLINIILIKITTRITTTARTKILKVITIEMLRNDMKLKNDRNRINFKCHYHEKYYQNHDHDYAVKCVCICKQRHEEQEQQQQQLHNKFYEIYSKQTITKFTSITITTIANIAKTTNVTKITKVTTFKWKKFQQLSFNRNHNKSITLKDNSKLVRINNKSKTNVNDNNNKNNNNNNNSNNNMNRKNTNNNHLILWYGRGWWWRCCNLIRRLNLRLCCYWWWWSCWLLCLIVSRRSATGITKASSASSTSSSSSRTRTTTSTTTTITVRTGTITGRATTIATILSLKAVTHLHKLLLFIACLHLLCWCNQTQAIRLTNSLTKSSTGNKEQLYIGLIAPHTNFGKREYLRAIHTAVAGLNKTRGAKLTFFKDYQFEPRNIRFDMMSLTPSPTAILSTLCKEFLQFNVSAILYMMNNEQFGHSTASAQYFLQLAGYLGIPVISWNADNSGLERRASQSTLQLQLAPSIEHQSAAMLSILERYKWHQFSIVTSQIAGHDDFVQAVRERVAEMQDHFKFTILNAIVVTRTSDLMELVNSEARVMLLYATQTEAITILRAAEDLKLTGENYVWVVSQSVIEKKDAHPQFPIGMLGVHFDTSSAALMNEISNAIKIYGYGVEAYVSDPANRGKKLNTQSLSCEDEGRGRWDNGETFFRYLRNVSIEGDLNKPNIEFTADGDLKSAELKIMNLRPSANNKNLVWEEIGVWKSWETQKLDIRDIAWPGNSHAPPQGVPEKFHLKITFLEEAPYINLSPADPVSGKCLMDRGVLCRVAADHVMADIDVGQAHRNESFYQCCSGFCIDLLEKFAEELGFTYELVRVEDGRWGTLENGKWNGLIADLVNRKTDMVLTSLMINTEREAVVDFSEPFMETGIAIVVAKRTGIISPTAFLEPFDTASWMLVGIVAIQAATFMIFLFEWLSPSGYDMKLYLQNTNATPYRFSLFRTYWLVWAVLFQAAVHVDSPRGFTSRFMTNVWALFAVVFLAIYTANLAAFMITREEFHEFSGLNDSRLVHPYSHKPPFKFGTIPYSHTDSTINKYFKEMHYYMKQHNKSSVADGVADVLSGNLDAFIYDGTVLDYLVAQDEDCRLMIVGSWYAMTGYGLAFSRNSKYVQMFNKRLLEFRANGDLERLRRYWMTGTCRPGKQEHKSSDPLALEQFLSAFLLLMAGILLAALLLLLEHIYFKYIRIRIAKKDGGHCCALISLSMGKSLTFRGAVFEATEILKKHRCNDPICDTHLWKVKHELDMTHLRVRQLEKALEKHGIKPPQLRLSSSYDLLNHQHLKERPPLLGNLSLAASAQDLYRWSYKTEIAEMETVL